MKFFTIRKQIGLIKKISKIIEKQIKDIDSITKKSLYPDEVEAIKGYTILWVKKAYLVLFKDIIRFLLVRLKFETSKNFRFYLLNLRTLTEVYARVLYLCHQDDNRQAAICMADRLFTLNYMTGKPEEDDEPYQKDNYREVQESYRKNYLHFKPFLDRESIAIPSQMENFSKGRLERIGLNFPSVEYMLKEEFVLSFCGEGLKVFPKAVKKLYNSYKLFSYYIHGNALSNISLGNERRWIIAKIQILSLLIVELFNNSLLQNSRKEELNKWIDSFKKERNAFVRGWKKDRGYKV